MMEPHSKRYNTGGERKVCVLDRYMKKSHCSWRGLQQLKNRLPLLGPVFFTTTTRDGWESRLMVDNEGLVITVDTSMSRIPGSNMCLLQSSFMNAGDRLFKKKRVKKKKGRSPSRYCLLLNHPRQHLRHLLVSEAQRSDLPKS